MGGMGVESATSHVNNEYDDEPTASAEATLLGASMMKCFYLCTLRSWKGTLRAVQPFNRQMIPLWVQISPEPALV
jgi:hypothetical protein